MNIKNRYRIELNKISIYLSDLERGHTYELTKTLRTPSWATLAKYLKRTLPLCLTLSRMTSRE